jgi:complex III assembly factor LYRM7
MAKVLTRTEVIQTYRYLLRSMGIAFQGDTVTLQAARKEARNRFEANRNLTVDAPEALEAISEARNVGKFLRENLVQGVKDESSDTYSIDVSWYG